MKLKMTHSLLAGLCALLAPVVLNAAETEKAKDDHDHDHAEHAGHDHDDKDHADHEGHDHAKKVAGPNGGKVIMNVEPHFELFVTKERKIQISFLDHDNKKVIPAAEQTVSVICGKRSAPVRMTFEKKDGVLISDKALPAGKLIPTIMNFKTKPDAKALVSRFNLNLNDCVSCDYLEYACTCDHGDHEGHNH